MLPLKLLVLFLCGLSTLEGCKFWREGGLMDSTWDDADSRALVVGSQRTRDATDNKGDKVDITFTTPIQIFDNARNFTLLSICDDGTILLEEAGAGSHPACKNDAAINGIISNKGSNDVALVAADALGDSITGGKYRVSAYHVKRSDQFDSANNVTGPSYCQLQIIEGIINDCTGMHRNDKTIDEFVVATWEIEYDDGGLKNYTFQAIIAASTNGTRTYVAFLYDSHVTIPSSKNNRLKGHVLADSGALSSTVREALICNATTDTDVHMRSNCRCAQKGHYVFETTEDADGVHKFCGTAPETCESQDYREDDSKTINRNCAVAKMPSETCDHRSQCFITTTPTSTTYTLKVFGRNLVGTNITFFNETRWRTSFPSGFSQSWGENVTKLDACTFPFSSANGTYSEVSVPVLVGGLGDTCFTYDSSAKTIRYVALVWNMADGMNVVYDGSAWFYGTCNPEDLPEYVSSTHKVQPVSTSTHQMPTGRALWMYFSSQTTRLNEEIILPTTMVRVGRMLTPRICFSRGLPYAKNADPYGIFGKSCKFSNNADFEQNPTSSKYAFEVINSNGCLTTLDPNKIGGRLTKAFAPEPATDDTSMPFCIATSEFAAFKWIKTTTKVFMQCNVGFCTNTQLFPYSKCKDSCANSIINVNDTDVPERRRKRQAQDEGEVAEETVYASYQIDVDVNVVGASGSNCADPTVAKSVIGALVASLVIATIVAVLLFWRLQTIKTY